MPLCLFPSNSQNKQELIHMCARLLQINCRVVLYNVKELERSASKCLDYSDDALKQAFVQRVPAEPVAAPAEPVAAHGPDSPRKRSADNSSEDLEATTAKRRRITKGSDHVFEKDDVWWVTSNSFKFLNHIDYDVDKDDKVFSTLKLGEKNICKPVHHLDIFKAVIIDFHSDEETCKIKNTATSLEEDGVAAHRFVMKVGDRVVFE